MASSTSKQLLSQQDTEIDFSLLFQQIWQNKWLVLGFMIVTLIIGVFYAKHQLLQYEAEILLQIKPNLQSTGLGQLSQQFSFSSGKNESEATQIALIKSSFILAPVVQSLGLDINAVPKQGRLMHFLSPSRAKIIIKKFEVPRDKINHQYTLVIKPNNHFSLYNSHQSLLLNGEVGKLSSSKDGSVSVLVTAIDAPSNTTFTLTKMAESNIVSSLQHQLTIRDLGENKISTGVLAIALRNTQPSTAVLILNKIGKTIQIKDIEKNAMEASQTLEFLYHQLPNTKQSLESAESALNKYRAKSGKIDIKIQSGYLLQQLTEIDKHLSEVRIDKLDKLQRYTTAHPLIIAMNTKLHELAVERSKLESQLKKLPASDQIAVNLMRDVQVKKSLYVVLLRKIQELEVVKAGIVSDVRILTKAKLPHDPLPQKNRLIYIASLIIGFLLSMGIIFGRKLLFVRVDDPHWGERHFDLTNLAIIPYSKEQFAQSGSLKNKVVQQYPLLAHVNPRNLSIESLRSLRTTLQVRLSSTTNNIVCILGISPGVGKTFVSCNLAYLLATAGKRVVLIDTDMRRGSLNKYFKIPPSPGLADVLNDKRTLQEVLIPTMHDNLTIIPRGTYPQDPSELLSRECFKKIIDTVSEQFDIVIIDTPPVLLVTDAMQISAYADTNYLVMGANAHQPKEIELSIKRLSNSGIMLNGSIFNFHKQGKRGQSGYGYGYGYKYYYDDKEAVSD